MPISFTPSEEQQMIVNTVRQLATDEVRQVYRDCDESGEIPDDVVNTAWELGLIATGVPATFRDRLQELGFTIHEVDVSEFKKAGGGIHCLINVLE